MKSVIIYGPGTMVRLVSGEEAAANAMAAVTGGGVARRLHGSALSNLSTALDPRLPATIEAFDATYPGLEDWHA